MYDDAYVFVATTDDAAASNAIVAKGAIRIHKVCIEGDGSNVVSVQLHNALTVTGTAEISLTVNEQFATEFGRYAGSNFEPPFRFGVGLSINITGNAATARIYYSR